MSKESDFAIDTLDEVQMAGDWASKESVKKYAKVEVSEGKAIKLTRKEKKGNE